MTSQRASFFPSETNIFVVEFRYYPAPKSNPICKNQPNQSMMFLLGFHVKFPGLFLKKSSLPLHANSRFFPSSAHPKAGSLLQHPQNDILFCRYIMTFKDCQCQERVQFLCCFPTLRMIMIRKRTQKISENLPHLFGDVRVSSEIKPHSLAFPNHTNHSYQQLNVDYRFTIISSISHQFPIMQSTRRWLQFISTTYSSNGCFFLLFSST